MYTTYMYIIYITHEGLIAQYVCVIVCAGAGEGEGVAGGQGDTDGGDEQGSNPAR